MESYPSESLKKIYSQHNEVKYHVTNLHIAYIEAVSKLKALQLTGYLNTGHVQKHRLAAFQALIHLRHFGVLSGGIPDNTDVRLKEIDTMLSSWDEVTIEHMETVIDYLEEWFLKSYFYDVRMDQGGSRRILTDEQILRAAGLK